MRLPFNAWSKERIRQGRKFCTSRHKRYPDDPRVFQILPQMPWHIIRDYLYTLEGADSPEELQEVIEGIMKRHVPDNELFYVHVGDFRGADK